MNLYVHTTEDEKHKEIEMLMQAWLKIYFEILNGSDWYATKTLKVENRIK